MCSVLDVSRSGYYAWLKRPPSVREQADEQALNDIIEVYTASKGKLGQRKLWRRLVARGTRSQLGSTSCGSTDAQEWAEGQEKATLPARHD